MSIMCAAIHAVTNGLIEYFVYTTFMYTWPLACNMAETPTPKEKARILEQHRLALTQWVLSDWTDKHAERRMEALFAVMQGWE